MQYQLTSQDHKNRARSRATQASSSSWEIFPPFQALVFLVTAKTWISVDESPLL